jgi:two-component system chemotaxis sensor kinase CheA
LPETHERLTGELRENSMSVRMLPLRTTFERFRRLVHDLGIELGKEVDLAIEGAETELDKTVIDQLNEPLVHLIRNSMDHGVERPQARRDCGKPPRATIQLSALHAGAHVLIRVTDDGRGLDAEAVRARGVAQGLIDPSARLSEQEVFALILAPGFSTAEKITDVSGRGVGMDVVRRSVEALHGSIEIQSRPGAGMTVTLRLPLTLAIIDGLLVRVGDAHFVLPLANSLECVELTRRDVEAGHGNHLANVRGELIPYIRLSEYFRMKAGGAEREQIGFRFHILATDISTSALEKARMGIFKTELVRPVPSELRPKYLMRSRDPKAGVVRVAPELREVVEFRRVNFMDGAAPGDFLPQRDYLF